MDDLARRVAAGSDERVGTVAGAVDDPRALDARSKASSPARGACALAPYVQHAVDENAQAVDALRNASNQG